VTHNIMHIVAWSHTVLWTLLTMFITVRFDIPERGHPDYAFIASQAAQVIWIQWMYRRALKRED